MVDGEVKSDVEEVEAGPAREKEYMEGWCLREKGVSEK
jgi:hypothetical protein